MAIPVDGLFEAHLPVSDLSRAVGFYRDRLGLPLAVRMPERGVAFFWVGGVGVSMLGLWSAGTMPMRISLHTAFRVRVEDVLRAVEILSAAGVEPLDFDGAPAREPVVLAWMPALAIYFRDPDGNLLEYLAMLPESPRPELGVVPWSLWRDQK
ncbi:MAG: VOC family protein [Acidobacteria bacterium]|nr:VOC family protein [Acidobacteriota bacterium]